MTARLFLTVGEGWSARQAFDEARAEARLVFGAGYVGPVATKSAFVMITWDCLSKDDAEDLALRLVGEKDRRIDDERGPAGCIPLEDGAYLFFGWAPREL